MAQLGQLLSVSGGSGAFVAFLRVFACSFRLEILAFSAFANRSLRASELVFSPVMPFFSACPA
jgi:hypothetical protein